MLIGGYPRAMNDGLMRSWEIDLVRVKICGLTRPQDIESAAQAGAHAFGFVFYRESPRAVSVAQVQRLLPLVPPFITKVALFVNAEDELIRSVCETLSIDCLQFHGDETPEQCSRWGKPYIKAVPMKDGVNLIQYQQDYNTAQGLLLDTYVPGVHGGTGNVFDWSKVNVACTIPLILSGGLRASNVRFGIERIKPYAVDVSSGVESSPGIKSLEKMISFMREVGNAEI